MKTTNYRRSTLFLALLVSTSFGEVNALEVGFEGSVSYEVSQTTDNTAPLAEQNSELSLGIAQIRVFGGQRSQALNTGFSGEFSTRRGFEDGNDTFNTITTFTGSVDVALSSQTLRWYFGDVLTSVRSEDSVFIVDDLNQLSRNIFVTGPTYRSSTAGIGTTTASLFLIKQTQENEDLETLYSFSTSHRRATIAGGFYGVRFSDIYTDAPDTISTNPAEDDQDGIDNNRITVSVFSNRTRVLTELYTELGVSQYQIEEDEINGLNAVIRSTLKVGPKSTLTAEISHTLNDQRNRTVEALLEGDEDDGLQPEANGVFAETRFNAGYSINNPLSEIGFSFSVSQLNYKLSSDTSFDESDADIQDQYQGTLEASYSRLFGSRFRGKLSTSYERAEFINQSAYTDAIVFGAELDYTLTRTLSLEFSLTYDAAEGERTQVDAANEAITGSNGSSVDLTQTRALIGIRWAPPSKGAGLVSLQ